MSIFDSDLTTRQTDEMIVNSALRKFIDHEIQITPQIRNIDYMFYINWIYHNICKNISQWSIGFRNRNKIDVRNIKFRLTQQEPVIYDTSNQYDYGIAVEYDIDDNHFECVFDIF